MPGLLIRDLPDELHRKLKERAAQHRRSMANEALVLLETALALDELTKPELPQPFRGNFALTDAWLDQAKREGRA